MSSLYKILYEVMLSERIENLFPENRGRMETISDAVYALLSKSYAKVGGLKGAGFSNPQDMVENIPMWKIFRRGNDIKAVIMYKFKGGRKIVACGTDGSDDGKAYLAKMFAEDILLNRSYSYSTHQ